MRRLALLAGAVAAVTLTGCGGGGTPAQGPSTPGQSGWLATGSPTYTPAPSAPLVAVYRAGERPLVRSGPGTGTQTRLTARTSYGSPRVFLATGRTEGSWLEVFLPTRPNGSTGWVQASVVELTPARDRILVDLSARTITVTHDGRTTTGTVAVGAPRTPTPVGSGYVTDRIQSSNPHGAYGPFAVGTSLHSNQITEFAGSDGQVGIHGTDRPDLLGLAVSHGCVRVPDAVDRALEQVGLGAPVVIQP